MKTKYTCDSCNYVTIRSTDLKKHMLTKKHLMNTKKCNNDTNSEQNIIHNSEQNSEHFLKKQKKMSTRSSAKKYICDICDKKFTEKTSMYRHRRLSCKISKETINEIKNKTNKEISELKKQNKKLLEVVNKNADATVIIAKNHGQSMRMMTHAIKNLANAPAMGLLEKKDAMKLLTQEKNSKRSIEELLIYNHEKNMLGKFIGSMIINSYKKEDPEEQSFWSTDTSRLSFIVMQLLDGTGENEWVQDKTGIKIKKLIIIPLLEEIKNKLIKYRETNSTKKDGESETNFALRIIETEEIILEINNGTLHDDVLRAIAPSFGFDLSLVEKFTCTKCDKKFSVNNAIVLRDNCYCEKCADSLFPSKKQEFF